MTFQKGRHLSEEHKKKLSESHKGIQAGEKHPMFGRHHSEETKRKISEANTGQIPWIKGKTGVFKHSEEAKKKMSETKKGIHLSPESEFKKGNISWMRGKHHTEEARKKMSESLKGRISPMKGKHHTAKSRLILAESNKGNVPWNKGKQMSEEYCKNAQKAQMGLQAGEKSPLWRGGVSFLPYCHKFNEVLKERIRVRDNRICQLCGVKENGKKISVHHIHYDKPNCNPDLITLCFSCHSKANFNRDYYEALFMQKLKDRGIE